MASTTTAKAALRREIRRRAAALSPEERRESDAALFARFLALEEVAAAEQVLLFCGVDTEPDTNRLMEPLWNLGKETYLPRCLPQRGLAFHRYEKGDRLVTGSYGIPAPRSTAPLWTPGKKALLLAPGLCCDRRGYRLGHGGGYYDQYLARWTLPTVCLCRDCLLADALPVEDCDRRVDLVVTETALFRA